jgi:hypothetical protein
MATTAAMPPVITAVMHLATTVAMPPLTTGTGIADLTFIGGLIIVRTMVHVSTVHGAAGSRPRLNLAPTVLPTIAPSRCQAPWRVLHSAAAAQAPACNTSQRGNPGSCCQGNAAAAKPAERLMENPLRQLPKRPKSLLQRPHRRFRDLNSIRFGIPRSGQYYSHSHTAVAHAQADWVGEKLKTNLVLALSVGTAP